MIVFSIITLKSVKFTGFKCMLTPTLLSKINKLRYFWNGLDHPPSFLTNVCKYTVFFTSPLREAFNEKTIMEIFQLFHSISQLGLLSSLATAISGRTWLLLVFRWLDSYCINLLIFSHFTHPKCIHIDSHTKLSHDRKKLVSLLQILLTSLTLTFNVCHTYIAWIMF